MKYIVSALSIAALGAVIVGTATAQPSDVATVAKSNSQDLWMKIF